MTVATPIQLSQIFQDLSEFGDALSVNDIIIFLEYQGFEATNEDIEAISRRCDHDGDRLISFEEYAEILNRDY